MTGRSSRACDPGAYRTPAGGVLERVEIVDKDTTITQQTIRDCFTQQLYALELDPPPVGVTVERQLTLKVGSGGAGADAGVP